MFLFQTRKIINKVKKPSFGGLGSVETSFRATAGGFVAASAAAAAVARGRPFVVNAA